MAKESQLSLDRQPARTICLAFTILGLCSYFAYISLERLIAKDEGFYVVAARLVAEGSLPYLDFFYPQMPLLPYLYAGWMSVFGFDWISARLFSAFLSSVLGMFLYFYCRRDYGTYWALFAVFLFASSCFTFPWLSTAQTYTPSTCLLFLSCYFLTQWPMKRAAWLLLLAGALLGLAIDVRLFFAGLCPLFPIYIWYHGRTLKDAWGPVLWFCLGLAVALLPNLYFALLSYDHYYFNNLGYHLLRSDKPFSADLKHKWKIFKVLTCIDSSQKFEGWQYALVLYGAFFSLGLMFKKAVPFAVLIGFGLFALNFTPKPSYVQYFCTTVPFFVIGVVALFSKIELSLGKKGIPRLLCLFFLCLYIVAYSLHLPINLEKYTKTGEGVIGIQNEENAKNWNVSRVSAVARDVRRAVPPEASILSWWPGYLLELQNPPYPRTENHFGILVAHKLSQEQREAYHILTKAEMLSAIEASSPDVLILNARFSRKAFEKALQAGGYEKRGQFDAIRWFKRP